MSSAVAQENAKSFFLSGNHTVVKNRSEAVWVRLVEQKRRGEDFFRFTDYTKTGVKFCEGKLSNVDPFKLVGVLKEFFPNGVLKAEINYNSHGVKPAGLQKAYNSDGKLIFEGLVTPKSPRKIGQSQNGPVMADYYDRRLWYKANPQGEATLKDGNGFDVYKMSFNGDTIEFKDSYVDGLKDGASTGKGKNIAIWEEYKGGELVSGKSEKNGFTHYYTYQMEEATLDGLNPFGWKAKNLKKITRSYEGNYKIEVDSVGNIIDIIVSNSSDSKIEEQIRKMILNTKIEPERCFGIPNSCTINVYFAKRLNK